MFPKRKRLIDSTDRDILRLLNSARRPLSGHQIANKIDLSPPAIKPRLRSLESQGILKKFSEGKNRVFDRTFPENKKLNLPERDIRIVSPSKTLWGIDFKPTKKGKNRFL